MAKTPAGKLAQLERQLAAERTLLQKQASKSGETPAAKAARTRRRIDALESQRRHLATSVSPEQLQAARARAAADVAATAHRKSLTNKAQAQAKVKSKLPLKVKKKSKGDAAPAARPTAPYVHVPNQQSDSTVGHSLAADPGPRRTVWVTKSGTAYHRLDCHVLVRAEPVSVGIEAARARRLDRCRHCAPTTF